MTEIKKLKLHLRTSYPPFPKFPVYSFGISKRVNREISAAAKDEAIPEEIKIKEQKTRPKGPPNVKGKDGTDGQASVQTETRESGESAGKDGNPTKIETVRRPTES